eukprot:Filipodium_phascolosomae@DN1918_c0_g1_i2.p1
MSCNVYIRACVIQFIATYHLNDFTRAKRFRSIVGTYPLGDLSSYMLTLFFQTDALLAGIPRLLALYNEAQTTQMKSVYFEEFPQRMVRVSVGDKLLESIMSVVSALIGFTTNDGDENWDDENTTSVAPLNKDYGKHGTVMRNLEGNQDNLLKHDRNQAGFHTNPQKIHKPDQCLSSAFRDKLSGASSTTGTIVNRPAQLKQPSTSLPSRLDTSNGLTGLNGIEHLMGVAGLPLKDGRFRTEAGTICAAIAQLPQW